MVITICVILGTRYAPSFSQPNPRLKSLLSEHETTVVIAYFPLTKAKHSQAEYLSWLGNFLSFSRSPMIIFTSTELHPVLHRLRRNGSLPSFFIVDYQSPLQMPPIEPILSILKEQPRIDPERARHSVELYAVWCAKAFMLNRSTELNPFRSKFFFYVDAGAFRASKYRFKNWPDSSITSKVLGDQRLLLGMVAPLPRRFCPLKYSMKEGPSTIRLIEGTFMAGSISAVRWWTSVFYTAINDYLSRDFFIGKDQSVMNAIALAHADRVKVLLPFRIDCGNVWFAFGPLFAEQSERKKLSYSRACQKQNTSEMIIPFETVCQDRRNLL